jgi:integrase
MRNVGATSGRIMRLMAAAGITTASGDPARTHDIRHSYAITALGKMEREGLDPYAALPLLCAFMGHRDIQSTEYYLRLTGPMSADTATKMAGAYNNVFPEVN